MNQTKKRLSIINLAISITDIETIQLQMLKLGLLRSDSRIQEIITMLQAENYAQAQGLITSYIETPMEEILQRSAQKEIDIEKKKEEAIIEEFDLFVEEPEKQDGPVKEIDDLNAFIDPVAEPKKLSTQEQVNYDALLNVGADEILPDNIELDISHSSQDTFFDTATNRSIDEVFTQDLERDTFFDTSDETTKKEEIEEEEEAPLESFEVSVPKKEETPIEKEIPSAPLEENQPESAHYHAISYIDQKFQNMTIQYPPVQTSDENFPSVDAWLRKISHEGYSEDEIEEIIGHIEKLRIGNKAEAAELLLLTSATESKYARFQLARALYRGDLLQKNIPEAFALINALAVNDDYPEAICDLGQFYEYGVGVDKDSTKAKLLYKNAMELGIKRAVEHYKRLNNENEGFFSFLNK
ncbi:hypothetical protein MNB_SV-8-943 [hydrothermal vent metagenome]|uniref:Beta-lactamase n=1 Tax=hydrothermal vent metagenome TaxID=652676 RepID=A0A1W1BUX1_9ZZZZ